MLNSKQRAGLRGLANPMETILQVGKGGVGETTISGADDALTARELIKGRVLPTCELPPREVAALIANRTKAEVVQVIGTKFVLYRPNPEKNLIKI